MRRGGGGVHLAYSAEYGGNFGVFGFKFKYLSFQKKAFGVFAFFDCFLKGCKLVRIGDDYSDFFSVLHPISPFLTAMIINNSVKSIL